MKPSIFKWIVATVLPAALACPVRLAAQQTIAARAQASPRYTVVDLGPLGGTNSQAFYVTSRGVVSGEASLTD